jgi:hypothetical protein
MKSLHQAAGPRAEEGEDHLLIGEIEMVVVVVIEVSGTDPSDETAKIVQ